MALKIEELRDLNADELVDKSEALRKEVFQLRLTAKTGKLEKTHRVKQLRRDIARIATIETELKRGEAETVTKEAPKTPKTVVKKVAPAKKAAKKVAPAKAATKKAAPKKAEAKTAGPDQKGWFGKKKDK
jgi:large subunit ribosomal protein L29